MFHTFIGIFDIPILCHKEFKDSFKKERLFGYLFSLLIIFFVFWNLSKSIPAFARIPGNPLKYAVVFLPAYLINMFSLMLIRDFAVEKKTGIIEAFLSSGVLPYQIVIVRTISIVFVSFLETFVSLLWLEILASQYNCSLISYLNKDTCFILLLSILFSIFLIGFVITLVFYYSHVINYNLAIAFSITFIYFGWGYALYKLPIEINFFIIILSCIGLFNIAKKIMKYLHKEKLLME